MVLMLGIGASTASATYSKTIGSNHGLGIGVVGPPEPVIPTSEWWQQPPIPMIDPDGSYASCMYACCGPQPIFDGSDDYDQRFREWMMRLIICREFCAEGPNFGAALRKGAQLKRAMFESKLNIN